MKNRVKKLINSPLALLTIGTIISNIIPLLIQPVLTRLISPEELGLYNVAISLANLIIPIASLKLYQLIVTVKDDKEAELLTQMSINTVFLVSIIYLVVVIFGLTFDYEFSGLGWMALMIPFIVFIDGLFYVLTSYFNRYKDYTSMAMSDISRGSYRGILQVLLSTLKANSWGQIISHIISPIPFLIRSKKNIKLYQYHNRWVSFNETIKRYSTYKKQIIYTVPSQFINSFSYTLILLSVTALYPTKLVGYYSISVKLLGIPLILISTNISRIYLQKMTESLRYGNNFFELYKKIVIFLFSGSGLIFGFLAVVAPTFSEFLFGPGYEEAGKYISILALMFSLRFITSSIAGTYVIFSKQNREVFFQALLIVGGVISFVFANLFVLNIYQYFWLITLSYGLVYMVMFIDITRLVRMRVEVKNV